MNQVANKNLNLNYKYCKNNLFVVITLCSGGKNTTTEETISADGLIHAPTHISTDEYILCKVKLKPTFSNSFVHVTVSNSSTSHLACDYDECPDLNCTRYFVERKNELEYICDSTPSVYHKLPVLLKLFSNPWDNSFQFTRKYKS